MPLRLKARLLRLKGHPRLLRLKVGLPWQEDAGPFAAAKVAARVGEIFAAQLGQQLELRGCVPGAKGSNGLISAITVEPL
jgi:hypothetical protein